MDDNTRFRITPWPQQPLPHPGYSTVGGWALDRDSGVIRFDGEARSGDPLADGEAYLRLADLDLDDLDAVDDWLARYGALGVRQSPEGPFMLTDGWQGFYLHDNGDLADRLDGVREAAAKNVGHEPVETLSEFRYGALCIKDLVTAWRVIQGALGLDRAEWVSPVWEQPDKKLEEYPWIDEVVEDPDGEPVRRDGPAVLLNLYLSDGLRPFGPRVMTQRESGRPFNQIELATYNVLCLELFNHVVERLPYRTCANESCGRLFIRQTGRAQHGQNRSTGVLYCSADCARAQAQRQYRRRKRKDAPHLTLRPESVERDVSGMTIMRTPRVTLPVASGWLHGNDDPERGWIRCHWKVEWEGRRVSGLELFAEDNERQRLRVIFDPDDRDHLAAAYNSTAPGSIELCAPDEEQTQVSAILNPSTAVLIGLRYPGLIDHSATIESALYSGITEFDDIEDRSWVDRAQASLDHADEITDEFPALAMAVRHSLRPGLVAFVAHEQDPPPFVEPAAAELDRGSSIGIEFILGIKDARLVKAPLQAPGPPPSVSRLTTVVQQARRLTTELGPAEIGLEFGRHGEPEVLQLRDGTSWPLWGAMVSIDKHPDTGEDVMAVVPIGRLLADAPEPLMTCGISVGPRGHREEYAIAIDEDGVHVPEVIAEEGTISTPEQLATPDLSADEIRKELGCYWSALAPGLLERVISGLGREAVSNR